MPKYCVIPGFGEYIMGSYPNADVECFNNGGHIESRKDDPCATTKSAGPRDAGSTESPLTAAVVAPIRALRDRLPESPVLRDLATLNYSPAMLRLLETDHEIHSRAGDAVGMVSQFALLALVDPSSSTLAQSCYTEELHRWLIELANMVVERSEDEDLRAAVNRLVEHFDQQVGMPFGALIDDLRAESTKST